MSTQTTSRRLFGSFIVFLTVSAIYLYAFPQANVAFAVVVLLHALLGIVTTIILLFRLWRTLRDGSAFSAIGWVALTVGGLVGIALIWLGTSRNHWSLLYTHLALSFLGVTFLIANFARERGWFGRRTLAQIIVPLVALGVAVPAARFLREGRWATHSRNRIENPLLPPTTMDGEGDGPQGLFFPSSAQVYGTKKIPSKYFMESDSCKRCHEDIYNQWFSSAHHFLVLQQSVVSQVDRIHAGRCRHEAVEVVRGLPRSSRALQRVDGYADQGDRAPAGSPSWPRLHDVPLDCRSEKHDGPRRLPARLSEVA